MSPQVQLIASLLLAFFGFLIWQVLWWTTWWQHRGRKVAEVRHALIWRDLMRDPRKRYGLAFGMTLAVLGLVGMLAP